MGTPMDAKLKDLNLLLLFLTGWEEESKNEPGLKRFRSWKGYLFEILNELERENLITQYRNTKSVVLTDEGVARAKTLKEQFM